jgi:hypothetical protein
MFLLKAMAALDILAAAGMLLLHFNVIGGRLVFPLAMYLILKAAAFRDVASIIDLVAGLYILGMLAFGFHTFLVFLFALYILQKAIFSML